MLINREYRKIDNPVLKEEIWQKYQESFRSLQEVTGQNQECYKRDEFFSMLEDEDYIKFLLFEESEGEKKLIGFGTLSPNLEKAARKSYANPIKIQKELIDQYPNNNIFYVPIIFIIEEYRDRREIWFAFMGPMIQFVDKNKGAAAFDFSINANPNLPKNIIFIFQQLVKEGVTQTKKADFQEIDHQVYGVIKFS